jgi:hypothetical protein
MSTGLLTIYSVPSLIFSLVDTSRNPSIPGTSVPTCPNSLSTPPQFGPVVLWFFTYKPVAAASATICYPNITFWDVTVNIDLASGNLTEVKPLQQFITGSSNFSSLSANVTGAPLNGRAYNGIMFNLTNPDEFVLARQAATQVRFRTFLRAGPSLTFFDIVTIAFGSFSSCADHRRRIGGRFQN